MVRHDQYLSDWDTFKLLLWKNWSVTWNCRLTQIFSVLSPMTFCLVLVFLRLIIDVERVPIVHYEPIDLSAQWQELFQEISRRQAYFNNSFDAPYCVYSPRLILAYSPNNDDSYNSIIAEAAKELQPLELLAFPNCQRLRYAMFKMYYFAGICFDKDIPAMKSQSVYLLGNYYNRLAFVLVFPSELRIYKDTYISSHWSTNSPFPPVYLSENRLPEVNDGGYVGYAREGFLSLQIAISRAYIKLITDGKPLPEVKIQRFPYRLWDNDGLCLKLYLVMPVIFMAGYIYPLAHFAKHVVSEREKQTTDTFNLIGVPIWLNWSAWFVYGVTLLTISNLATVFVLKVHWNNGYAVLTNSSALPLLFLLLAVNMANVNFCLMICAFYRHTPSAVIMFCLLYFITYLPYETARFDQATIMPSYVLYLFSTTVQSMALELVLDFENYKEGLRWSDFRPPRLTHEYVGLDIYMLALCGQTVLYPLIAIYVRRMLYVPDFLQPVLAVFRRRSANRRRRSRRLTPSAARRSEVEEVELFTGQHTIAINAVTKEFDGFKAIKKVSMKCYASTITVLMGHNGAGKTTLLSMIIGSLKPTFGTIVFGGEGDHSDGPQPITFGAYMRGNFLINNLSVADQIHFFSRIRGMGGRESEAEVFKYLTAMELYDKRNVLTKDLSPGLRQRLAICCALAGDSQIIILDNPSRHMDSTGRKLFWKLLIEEKLERTIFMCSHNAEEVEALADRVAILSQGQLKFCGTTAFLKKLYGQNYRLICFKGQHCKSSAVTAMLEKHIPDIALASNLANELSYFIFPHQLENMDLLLDELEQRANDLNLERYEMSCSSLDDIFHQLGAEYPSESDLARQSEILNGLCIYWEQHSEARFLQQDTPITGTFLLFAQWKALVLKRLLYIKEYWPHLLALLVMPALVACLVFFLIIDNTVRPKLQRISFDLLGYLQTTTIVESRDDNDDDASFSGSYVDVIHRIGDSHLLESTDGKTFSQYLLNKLQDMNVHINRKYFVGASFKESEITAWFNNCPLHTAPLSLNMVYNAILQTYLDMDARIIVHFDPLPFLDSTKVTLHDTSYSPDTILAISLMICCCFIWPLSTVVLVLERRSGFKLLQVISGCRISSFWASSFAVDYIIVASSALVVVLTIIAVESYSFVQVKVAASYFIMLLLAGLAILSVNYLIALFSDNAVDAYIVAVTFGLFGTMAFMALLYMLNSGYRHFVDGLTTAEWLFRVFPQFSAVNVLIKVFNDGVLSSYCQHPLISLLSAYEQCNVAPRCCGNLSLEADVELQKAIEMTVWNLSLGDSDHSVDVVCLIAICTAAWLLVCLTEYRIMWRAHKCLACFHTPDDDKQHVLQEHERLHGSEDSGTSSTAQDGFETSERIKVQHLHSTNLRNKPLVCDRVSKYYKKDIGVDRLYLVVERAECLGLPKRAGPDISTMLRLIAGDEKMSYGNVYVNGISLKHDLYGVYARMGYCPEFNPLPAEYTPESALQIFCLLRGISPEEIKELSESLAKVLGFFDYFQKKLLLCSNGIKRRLCCAIAVINSPPLILLAHPTASVDPSSRRQLYYVIDKLRRTNGSSVLYSTMVARECEVLCTRLAIVSRGRLVKIGNHTDFSSKYRMGYILYIKLKEIGTKRRRLGFNIAAFVENKFTNSTLRYEYSNILVFHIPNGTSKMSDIFNKIYRNAFNLYIESFQIRCESFSNIFQDILEEDEYARKQTM